MQLKQILMKRSVLSKGMNIQVHVSQGKSPSPKNYAKTHFLYILALR